MEEKDIFDQIFKKCSFGDNVVIKPDGENELDPCIYEEIERLQNVTIIISKCKNCGHIDISWIRQPNTVKVDEDGNIIDDSPFAEK